MTKLFFVPKIKQDTISMFTALNGCKRAEMIQGPAFGVDVSLVQVTAEQSLAITSDPLSIIPSIGMKASAWLSVQLMVNDIATTGHAPQFGQFVLNLPETITEDDFDVYWQYIHLFCKEAGIAITGGHTCFVPGMQSTISGGGTLFCIVPKNQLLLSIYAQPGNVLLVTKSAALSSASLLALSFPETVKQKTGVDVLQNASESLYKISSLKEALLARQFATAMHDVTEGGVLGAAYEMAAASGNGLKIYANKIPVGEEQKAICKVFEIDPLRCIGAGSMLIACKKEQVFNIIDTLKKEDILCTAIGEFTSDKKHNLLYDNGQEVPLEYEETDPYWKAYFFALKNGWK